MPKKNRTPGLSYEQKLDQIRLHFEKNFKNSYVVYTFPDAVIIKNWEDNKQYEIEYSILDGKIQAGEPKEVEVNYILKRLIDEAKDKTEEQGENKALSLFLHYKREEQWPQDKATKREGTELTGIIFKSTEKQRIVYSAVLVPGEPDLDAENGEKLLTKEEIEFVAHKWMEEYGNIDYMHGLNNVAKPIETFLLPYPWEVQAVKDGEKMLLPEGTWVMAAKVINDTAWKKVESGELTGFSIMGIQNNVLKSIMEKASKGERVDKQIAQAMKRVLIRDLGKDWIVPFVSLVDEPCVPKAKFFAIKKKEAELLEEDKSVWNRIMKYFKKEEVDQIADNTMKMVKEAEKAGRTISDDTYSKLTSALEALQKLIEKADKERNPDNAKNKKTKGDELDMDEKDVIKLIDERLDEKLKPIDESLKALLPKEEEEEEDKSAGKGKVKKEADPEETEEEEEGTEEAEEEEGTDTETLKNENISLKETLKKLQEAKKGLSKAEKGQEDGGEEKPYTTKDHLEGLERDSLGRAIKKKE